MEYIKYDKTIKLLTELEIQTKDFIRILHDVEQDEKTDEKALEFLEELMSDLEEVREDCWNHEPGLLTSIAEGNETLGGVTNRAIALVERLLERFPGEYYTHKTDRSITCISVNNNFRRLRNLLAQCE